MPKKSLQGRSKQMTIITAPVKKTNGKHQPKKKAVVAAMKTVINPEPPRPKKKLRLPRLNLKSRSSLLLSRRRNTLHERSSRLKIYSLSLKKSQAGQYPFRTNVSRLHQMI